MERLEEQARIEAREARIAKAKELEAIKNYKHLQYIEAEVEYGPDHFVTLCRKEDWYYAIKTLQDYLNSVE